MRHDGFLRDVLAAPERLDALLDAYGRGSELDELPSTRRAIFIGMGSSRFAALPAAALLRSRGIEATVELASTALPAAPAGGTIAFGISASGRTEETVEALERHRGHSLAVAVTNDPKSRLAAVADVVLPLHAGNEEGGVACLTFQATLAALQLLAGRLSGGAPGIDELRPAVGAAAALRDSRGSWLEELASRIEGGGITYTIAPDERQSSALESALMLREGPRRAADATETGDWLHVDVYLSRRPGYTALLFTGSRFDDAVMAYARERGCTMVAIGRERAGAAQTIALAAATPTVALLVETGVAELAAAELWRRGVEAGDPALAG